jgi:DNA-binding transcriptional LysR family regulator
VSRRLKELEAHLKEIENGTLLPLFTDFSFPAIDAYVIYPRTRHLSQRVRTMVDFLVRKFEGLPYWDTALQVM